MKLAQKRAIVPFFRVSERRGGRVAGVARSSCRYRRAAREQTAVRLRLRDLAAVCVCSGDRQRPVRLERAGSRVTHKRDERDGSEVTGVVKIEPVTSALNNRIVILGNPTQTVQRVVKVIDAR